MTRVKTFRCIALAVRSDHVDARNLHVFEALVRAQSLTVAKRLLRQHGLTSKDWRRAFVRDEDVLDVPGVGQVAWRDEDGWEGEHEGRGPGWIYVTVDEYLDARHSRWKTGNATR